MRLGATLVWAQGPWTARLGANHSAAQTDVPDGQNSTKAYTLWNVSAAYSMKVGPTQVLWFAKLENITDALAYSASSILTQTAPGKAPMPGRTAKLGVRWSF